MFGTSRGCYNHCSFCWKICKGIRTYSIQRIREDIKTISKLNPRAIAISDEVFTYDKKRAIKICKILKEFNLPFIPESRIDDIDDKIIKKLISLGCIQIRLGVESFDQNILNLAHKNITLKQIYKSINVCNRAGITPLIYIILGLPGENRQTLKNTIENIRKLNVTPRVSIFIPLPGTEIYNQALLKNKIDEVKLLEFFSDYSDPYLSNKIYLNLTNLSNEELLAARDEINSLIKK